MKTKTAKTISKEIENRQQQQHEIEIEIDNISSDISKLFTQVKNKNIDIDTYKINKDILNNKISEISKKSDYNKLYIKCLENNYRIMVFYETFPIIKQVMTKYKNKAYGEKTKTKIYNEIYNLSGFHVSIKQHDIIIYPLASIYNYSDTINIYHSNYNINFIDAQNIICDFNNINIDDLKVYGIHDYYYNIPKTINEIFKAYKKAYDLQNEFIKVSENFNSLIPFNIDRIYYNSRLYKNFI